MPRPKRWFHVSQDINFDPEFECLCKKFGLGGVRFFLQVMAILDKTENHWSLPKDFDLNVLARCCGTKPRTILGSYQLLIDMKWISVGVDENLNQFILAPNYLKYRGNRVHEKEKVKRVSYMPPYLPLPIKEIHKEKRPNIELLKNDRKVFEEFWETYPARNGKKLEKSATEALFCKLSPTEQQQVVQAAQNYAASDLAEKGIGIKDPKRFLRNGKGNEPWRDWLEPEQPKKWNDSDAVCARRIDVAGSLKFCGQPASTTVGKSPMCQDCYQVYQKEQSLLK